MPDALELPRMRRAVVPLMRPRDAVVDKRIAHRLPRLTAVVGALDKLAEPAGRLRGVEPLWVDGRAGEVEDLPAAKERIADRPSFALAVGGQDKCAFARTNQHAYSAHRRYLA